MQTIITESDLRTAILQLESRQADEVKAMKAQFLVAVDSIKPINLIKSTFIEAAESRDLKDNLINKSLGLSAGYVTKVLIQGATGGPVRKIIGTVLMFGIKNLVARNPDKVKRWGRVLFGFARNLTGGKDKKPIAQKAWNNAGE